jgi:DnaJ-class molecular chaperone
MLKEYYELLGVAETATDEEIKRAYETLKEKYKEDRWLDGEAGNEAARMLNKLDTAYAEITSARRETKTNTEGQSAFEKVSAAIKNGDLEEAQRLLDNFNERSAEWHYLQAGVFFGKKWYNESKKQLEIAIQMDETNVKYRDEYNKLNSMNDFSQAGRQQNAGYNQNPYSSSPHPNGYDEPQMGGNACADCISCCYMNLCINCLFNFCCGCH